MSDNQGLGNQLLGMIGGHQQERRNYRNNRNLMNLQMQNQAGLNRQGHDLQMDMWNKTNYGAQVGHMQDAGLNPALMYKGAGAGGTTGSQGGGSASMGSSQQGKVMDMSNLMMGAQIRNLDAKTKEIEGKTPLAEAQIDETTVRADLGRANIEVAGKQLEQITANINKIMADTNLTKKIQEMDYGGEMGKNMSQNILDLLTGEAGLDTMDYIGIVSGIGALTALRSSSLVGKGISKGKAAIGGAITKLKGMLKGKKAPFGTKARPNPKMTQQDYMDIINNKRNANQ